MSVTQNFNHSCQSLPNLTRYSQIQFQRCCKLHLNACSSAASGSLCVIITYHYSLFLFREGPIRENYKQNEALTFLITFAAHTQRA